MKKKCALLTATNYDFDKLNFLFILTFIPFFVCVFVLVAALALKMFALFYLFFFYFGARKRVFHSFELVPFSLCGFPSRDLLNDAKSIFHRNCVRAIFQGTHYY